MHSTREAQQKRNNTVCVVHAQVIVPFFITFIELWLRFGWNSEAIPQISRQPLMNTDTDGDGTPSRSHMYSRTHTPTQSRTHAHVHANSGEYETTGFIWSTAAKGFMGTVNALNFALAGTIVNNCSDIEFEAVFVWILKHYHEVLVGAGTKK